ncbi:MAG: TonB-dependent receptor plug domain-containing protein, partial [Myxococcota bacterium]
MALLWTGSGARAVWAAEEKAFEAASTPTGPRDEDGFNEEFRPDDSERLEDVEIIRVTGGARFRLLEESSANALTVLSTENDVVRSADLGEILARSAGISVQRTGGLGSAEVISLNGLRDQQIRLFLDGIPLDAAGFPFGIANVPVNLVQNVEVYRGVVPITFGADALGGAINLVSRPAQDNGADASYQFGSFNTHRATGVARGSSDDGRFYAQASGFYDYSDNDFDITVLDDFGEDLTVPRFNGRYEATGLRIKAGASDLAFARELDATLY